MTCIVLSGMLLIPRVTLAIMWLLSYTHTAFQTRMWPLLGFLFMPFTTCAYAIGMNERGGFQGWTLVVLIIGVVLDFGGHHSTYSKRNRSVFRRRC